MTTLKKAKTAKKSSQLIEEFQQQAHEQMLKSSEFGLILEALAGEVSDAASAAKNEAEVVSCFETRLYKFLHDAFHLDINFEKEVPVATVRHVAKGRMDSRVGALVIEYKHPSKLKNKTDRASAADQLTNYLQSLARTDAQGLIGIVTDGVSAQIIRLAEDGKVSEEPLAPLNAAHFEHIVRGALLLQKTALTPENLVRDFCRENTGSASVIGRLVQALYHAMSDTPTERSSMLFHEWQSLFRLAHDDASKQQAIVERREAISAALNITIAPNDNETEYRALYSLQTAFAIVVKIIALKVIGAVRHYPDAIFFHDFASAGDEAIRSKLARLEGGDIFRDMGFGNLLEGDFFAWYCTKAQWDQNISAAVKEVFGVLAVYESQPLFTGSHGVRDFFKDLYMHVIPDRVRHSLGEFYTPPWLASHVVTNALQEAKAPAHWRGVDPCCGSGTFLTILLKTKIQALHGKPRAEILRSVLSDVKGVDLNPLAVLTARINYFINISHLVGEDDRFEIPVYLGDASYVPEPTVIGGIDCIRYQVNTLEGSIDVVLPRSAIADTELFSRTMTAIESDIKNQDAEAVALALSRLCSKSDHTEEILAAISALSQRLVELEVNNWNGIWARIITNFLTTANLGKFDIIVSNPPWIDWKNLPAGYRDRIKSLCIDRRLFSGDGVTGGINLNVCALIANVSAGNWLADKGVLAFLMPEPLVFQQSYEGFRKLHLKDGSRLYFQRFDDWTKSGHPFAPVQQPFLTYVISRTPQDYRNGIPVLRYKKRPANLKNGIRSLSHYAHVTDFADVVHVFEVTQASAFTASLSNTVFSYATAVDAQARYKSISGVCSYHGREGIEFYPQELFLLECLERHATEDKVWVRNYQNPRSKHKVAQDTRLLEKKFLHPLIKGIQIARFSLAPSQFVVPFPYAFKSRTPIDHKTLGRESRGLMDYLNDHRGVIDAQTSYNDKIIGAKHAGEFYALARVGEYSYGDYFVAFRDNTKWGGVVVSDVDTPWDEKKRPVFQNHAVSISQTSDGRFIDEAEAHYICAILNAPVVAEFLVNSSDSRSFKIRPPINVPVFDPENAMHKELSALSKKAHLLGGAGEKMAEIDAALDATYLAMLAGMAAGIK